MPSRLRPPAVWLVVLLSVVTLPLASCGGSGEQRDTAAADTLAADDTASAEAAGESETWDISPADVDRYVRALEAKNDSLRVASRRVRAIAVDSIRLREYSYLVVPITFLPVEVRAAGVSQDRYLDISNNLRDAYSMLTGGAPDEETKRATLDRLRADTRQALERQIPRIKRLDEVADSLIGAASGMEKIPGR